MYTWHFTFDGQTALHELVDSYQERLAGLPRTGSDTAAMAASDHAGDRVHRRGADTDIEAIIEASRQRLADVPRATVMMGPAVLDPEVVRLEVRPADGLTPVRGALRDAIAVVRGAEQVGESSDWTPYVSVAHSNAAGPMELSLKVLDPPLEPVNVEITGMQLIILERDTHLYQWQTRAVIDLR